MAPMLLQLLGPAVLTAEACLQGLCCTRWPGTLRLRVLCVLSSILRGTTAAGTNAHQAYVAGWVPTQTVCATVPTSSPALQHWVR
jgi:hypothetical protein